MQVLWPHEDLYKKVYSNFTHTSQNCKQPRYLSIAEWGPTNCQILIQWQYNLAIKGDEVLIHATIGWTSKTCSEKEDLYTSVHTVWFRLFDVPEQAELFYGEKIKTMLSSGREEVGFDWQWVWEKFLGWW